MAPSLSSPLLCITSFFSLLCVLQFARVKIQYAPVEEDEDGATDFTFISDIKGGSVPKEYIPGVQKGVESVLANGVLAGFPVLGLKATLVDGAYHDVDSSVMAFEIAGRAATREGLRKAGARLMEPIMKVDVVTPEEYMGDIIGDINSRRGQVCSCNFLSHKTYTTTIDRYNCMTSALMMQ